MAKRSFPILAALVLVLWGLSAASLAQGTFSRLTGVVSDANGAAVAGAAVTLVNEGTNVSQTAQTSESGVYVFDSINVGSYRVEVEKQGFKKFVSGGNVVNVSQVTTVDVRLEAGNVSEVVTVESAAELVQTSSSGNIGNTVEQRTLEALPIVGTRGRNPLTFIDFQPGVVSGANTGGGVHVNGARDRAFNFTLDGIDINETSAGGSNFTPLRPNPDSIQEFQVITSNFTADQGRSSGAQVGLVTRAGTNSFQGNAFWFYQTPDVNANEFENNLNNVAKRQFVQHIFGGSFGGPIIKDKAFFFTNLQFLRAYETRLVSRTVYTQQARQGILRYVFGGINRPAGVTGASVDSAGNPLPGLTINSYNVVTNNPGQLPLDPSVLRVLALTPLPNNFAGATGCTPDGLNTGCFNFAAASREKQYDFTVRGDYRINDQNNIYIRYAQGEQNSIGDAGNTGQQVFPDTPRFVDTFRDPKNLAVNYRITPSANLTNEFIFGINRFSFSFDNPDPNFESNPPFTFNLVAQPLNNSAAVNNARTLNTNQFVDNLTYIYGDHTFKTGLNFRFGSHKDERSSVAGTLTTLVANFSTTFNPVDPAAFGLSTLTGINAADRTRFQSAINDLLGRVGSLSRAFVAEGDSFAPAGTSFFYDARYPEYDFYFQDTWKARANLTFDLGVRWELRPSPGSKGKPILVPDRPIRAGEPPANDVRFVEGDLFKDDFNNLSPSLGFAWDPEKNGKSSVRANYRLAYDRMNTFVLSSSIYQSLPGLTLGITDTAFGQAGGTLRNGLPILAPPAGRTPESLRQPIPFSSNVLTVVDPDLQFPKTHQWAISYQRDIGWGIVAEASYIGRRADNLFGGYDANQVNLNARDTRFSNETFLEAFNTLRNDPAANSRLINTLLTGDPLNNAGTTQFRNLFVVALTPPQSALTGNVGGSVATVAQQLSQRTCSAANVSAGICQNTSQQLISRTLGNPFFFQPYPQFTGALNVLDSNDYSRYNALELLVKRRFQDGFSFQLSYTLARSKDTRSFDPAFTVVGRGAGQSASSSPFDINNRDLNYARSDFDRKHAIQGFYVVEVPFGRGRKFGSDIPRALDWLVGGWNLSGILLYSTGRPFTVFSGVNTFSNVVQSTANCNGCSRKLGGVIQESGTTFYFSEQERELFGSPAPGDNGNTGRNYFQGPSSFRTDLSISKRFNIDERRNIEFRTDIQNLTNTAVFGFPTTTLNSPTFGRIRDTVLSFSRRMQFGLKITF